MTHERSMPLVRLAGNMGLREFGTHAFFQNSPWPAAAPRPKIDKKFDRTDARRPAPCDARRSCAAAAPTRGRLASLGETSASSCSWERPGWAASRC